MEYKQSRKALGTDIEISIISEDQNTKKIADDIFGLFDSIEKEFSRFLPLSSLSILNSNKKLSVSNRFLDLLNISKIAYQETNGFFNPLTDISAIGYKSSFEKNEFEKSEEISDLDFDNIFIEGNYITLKENQKLDFGGICKGFVVSLASDILRSFGYDDYFINAGGDIYASGKNNERQKWIIGVENPFDGKLLASVKITDKSIATSGNYRRKWKIGEENLHHILNPKTGKNRFEIASVTLISDNPTLTDAYTKAVYNMDIVEGMDFIEKKDLAGLIILSDGKIYYSKNFGEKFEATFYQ